MVVKNIMIYDYFKDIGNTTMIFYGFLAILFIIIILVIIISLIFGNKTKFESIVKISACIILILILSLSIVPNLITQYKMKAEYSKGECLTIAGQLHNIKIEYYGGRGETYDVSFCVDDELFSKSLNTTKEIANKIQKCEDKQVSICYSIDYDIYEEGKVVYSIQLS